MSRDALRLDAARLIVAKVIAEQVRGFTEDVRRAAEAELEPGEKVKAVLSNGTPIGTIMRTETPKSVKIDHSELTEWVRANRPDEIVVTESIRESYVKALIEQCKKHGHAFDPETGEVIPGVELYDGTPSFRVTPSEDGRAYIESNFRFRADLELPGEADGEPQP